MMEPFLFMLIQMTQKLYHLFVKIFGFFRDNAYICNELCNQRKSE